MKAEKKKSWSQELSLYNTWISSTLGSKRMNDITYKDVERIRDTILENRSERTAQYVIAIIRRAFNVAINRDHFFGSNPTKKVKIPYPDNAKVRFFTKAQANDFLTLLRAKSPQLAQMAEVSLFSGLRWGEVAALTWIDVDLEHGTIFVAHPKNTFARTVPMPQRLIKMFSGKDRPTGYGLIFPSKSGDKSLWVSKTVKRVIDDMKLNEGVTDRRQHITYHSTRHSFCSWLAMEGKPLHTIGKLAGHRTSKMTERYSHLLPDTLAAAVSVLDKPDYDQSPKSEKKDVAYNADKKNNVLEFRQLKAANGKT